MYNSSKCQGDGGCGKRGVVSWLRLRSVRDSGVIGAAGRVVSAARGGIDADAAEAGSDGRLPATRRRAEDLEPRSVDRSHGVMVARRLGAVRPGSGMVRWFGYSASFGLVCVLVASGGVGAQAPGAPAVGSVTGGDQALTVSWTVPAGVDEVDITRYDLRYIETDAPDKTDPNWTVVERVWSSGPLAYVLTGLANGIGYDVQVRAVTTVDGGWSVTAVGTPTEPSSTQTAITLPFDIQVGGVIDPGSDTDYFKVATNETVHVFIKAVSEDLRLGGDLLDEASQSTGAHVYTQFPNDPLLTLSSYDPLLAHIPMDSRVLVVRTRLEAGTYYLKVNRTGGATSGSYTIEVVEDPDYAFFAGSLSGVRLHCERSSVRVPVAFEEHGPVRGDGG